MNAQSRAKTGETGSAWPVRIKGYERHWSVMSPEFGMSSVAVIPNESAQCNGVLIEIEAEEIAQFDEREAGYQRAAIAAHQIEAYFGTSIPEGQVWIYHSHKIDIPSQSCPIVLSYLDVILAGCLDYGADFVEDFLMKTHGWEGHTLNDRNQPRYPRVQPELDVMILNRHLETHLNLSPQELSVPYEV